MYSAMFCFCFSSTENPPLGMLTEARLNLDTRSGKSKEIQLKVWKKWNKGKRKICHRSFTLDKSAGLDRKTTEGSKTAKKYSFFLNFKTLCYKNSGLIEATLSLMCLEILPIVTTSQLNLSNQPKQNQGYFPSAKPHCTAFFSKQLKCIAQ